MEAPTQTNICNINIARTAILDQDGRLLVLWRHDEDDYNSGGPDLPGGGVEPDESPEQASIRETLEETGIDLAGAVVRRVYESVHDIPDGDGTKRMIRTFFAAYVSCPEVTLSSEHKDYEFMTLDKARETFVDSTTKLQCLSAVVALQASGKLTA